MKYFTERLLLIAPLVFPPLLFMHLNYDSNIRISGNTLTINNVDQIYKHDKNN